MFKLIHHTKVSVDGYAQWLVGLFEKGLSEDEVLQLNVVFGDPAKKALLDKLFEKLHGKKGDDFVREVREFQRTTDAGLADEIVRFAQSPAAAKYGAVLGEIKSGRKEVVIRLFMEADHRIRARQK